MAGEPYVHYSLHFLRGKSQNLSDVIIGSKMRSTCTWSKLPTFACWSREKREERCEANYLCVSLFQAPSSQVRGDLESANMKIKREFHFHVFPTICEPGRG